MSDKELFEKIAVVTGSSRGIGRGIAIGLGEQGATVYVTGRSSGSGPLTIHKTAELVNDAGGTGIPVEVDLAHDDQIEALYDRSAKPMAVLIFM